MFISGETTPRLGIDLAGGTSFTLEAKNEPGKKDAINSDNMNTAVNIINSRVNGLGVSEAEVQTQGAKHIIVNIPKGTNAKQARQQVGTTAQLYFRPVLTYTDGQKTPDSDSSPTPRPAPAPPTRTTRTTRTRTRTRARTTGRTATPRRRPAAPPPRAGPCPRRSRPTRPRRPTRRRPRTRPRVPTPPRSPAGTPPTPQHRRADQQLAALDCTDKQTHAKADEKAANADPKDPIVACNKDGKTKYVLGPPRCRAPTSGRLLGLQQPGGRLDRPAGLQRQGRQAVRRRHRQAGQEPGPAERVRDRPRRPGGLQPERQRVDHRWPRHHLRQFHPAVLRGPGERAVLRRAAAELRHRRRDHRLRRARQRAAEGRSDRRCHRPGAGHHLPGALLPRPGTRRHGQPRVSAILTYTIMTLLGPVSASR
ncbi:hypothetical protein NKH77_43060 [Streptomyces sp. M19]